MRNINFTTGNLYDSENKEIFCKCGKKSSMAIIGEDSFLVRCSDCAGFSEQDDEKQ
jgi:hypothetical protein